MQKLTLKAARVNAGLSQEKASELLHINRTTLWHWERGTRKPSFANMKLMSSLYDCPIELISLPEKST